MRKPFRGVVYARGYPAECRQVGNGSERLRFTVRVNECGTKITEQKDGKLLYEALLYVQYDRHVQQGMDELLHVRCTPQREIVVTGSMRHPGNTRTRGGTAAALSRRRFLPRLKVHNDTGTGINSSYATTPDVVTRNASKPVARRPTPDPVNEVDSWMDILEGSMPFVKPVSGYVNVGQDMTMLIKIRHRAAGTSTRVTQCIAHDGSRELEQELTDNDGCSIDTSILPDLTERMNPRTGLKVVFTTFKAFKFPDRDNLHLQCKVLICNQTCPISSCKKGLENRERHRRSLHESEMILDKLDVYNSVEVKTTSIDVGPDGMPLAGRATLMDFPDQVCLSSSRMVLVLAVLAFVLVGSLVVSICMCVRAREWRKRFAAHRSTLSRPPRSGSHGFPYGRVVDF